MGHSSSVGLGCLLNEGRREGKELKEIITDSIQSSFILCSSWTWHQALDQGHEAHAFHVRTRSSILKPSAVTVEEARAHHVVWSKEVWAQNQECWALTWLCFDLTLWAPLNSFSHLLHEATGLDERFLTKSPRTSLVHGGI